MDEKWSFTIPSKELLHYKSGQYRYYPRYAKLLHRTKSRTTILIDGDPIFGMVVHNPIVVEGLF